MIEKKRPKSAAKAKSQNKAKGGERTSRNQNSNEYKKMQTLDDFPEPTYSFAHHFVDLLSQASPKSAFVQALQRLVEVLWHLMLGPEIWFFTGPQPVCPGPVSGLPN